MCELAKKRIVVTARVNLLNPTSLNGNTFESKILEFVGKWQGTVVFPAFFYHWDVN